MTTALEGGEWSAARSGLLYPRERPGTHCTEAGWASGPVLKGGKTGPTGIRYPDRLARSSVAIPTELPGPNSELVRRLKRKKTLDSF